MISSWTNENVKSSPFMAELSQNGTKFSQMYSTHRCSPTRAALLTGRYPFRNGLKYETFISKIRFLHLKTWAIDIFGEI